MTTVDTSADRNKRIRAKEYASVDYLTVTTKSDRATSTMLALVAGYVGPRISKGEKIRRWQFMGFHGQSMDGVRYGLRGTEGIAILTSVTANELWRQIAPARSKCTRIDLAVTVRLEEANQYVASVAYKEALDSGQLKSSLIVNSQGGATVYLGSRTSMFFGRVYDKSSEQGVGAGTEWRYEIECKKPASEAVIALLLEQDEPATWIGAYVWNWFFSRGVRPIFNREITENAIEIAGSVASLDRTLQWLTTQVRPSVGRLIIGGYEAEVREALQLPLQK